MRSDNVHRVQVVAAAVLARALAARGLLRMDSMCASTATVMPCRCKARGRSSCMPCPSGGPHRGAVLMLGRPSCMPDSCHVSVNVSMHACAVSAHDPGVRGRLVACDMPPMIAPHSTAQSATGTLTEGPQAPAASSTGGLCPVWRPSLLMAEPAMGSCPVVSNPLQPVTVARCYQAPLLPCSNSSSVEGVGRQEVRQVQVPAA